MINKFLYFWGFITISIIIQILYIFYDSINIIYLRIYEIIFTITILFSILLFLKFRKKIIKTQFVNSHTNEVYLTKFKTDNFLSLYTKHIIYGFYSYYKDPINMFFLFISINNKTKYNTFHIWINNIINIILLLL
jgi:hypothetical protein